MLRKALILEIRSKYALALNDRQEFVRLAKKPGMVVSREVWYTPEDLYTKPQGIPVPVRLAAVAAAVLLVLVSGLLIPGGDPAAAVAAVVSVDMEPSVQLELDRELNVIGVRVLSDGGKLPEKETLRGISLQEALDRILPDSPENPEDSTVLFGITVLDESLGEEQLEEICRGALIRAQHSPVHSGVLSVPADSLPGAGSRGLSSGRYQIWLESQEDETGENPAEDPEERLEEIRNAPVGKLVRENARVRSLDKNVPGPPAGVNPGPPVPEKPEKEEDGTDTEPVQQEPRQQDPVQQEQGNDDGQAPDSGAPGPGGTDGSGRAGGENSGSGNR